MVYETDADRGKFRRRAAGNSEPITPSTELTSRRDGVTYFDAKRRRAEPVATNQIMHTLILVPTTMEAEALGERIPGVELRTCGFGLPAAAARASQLLADVRPRRVLLVGLAGIYTDAEAIGTVAEFDWVRCWGIGVGESFNHVAAGQMGWPQFDSPDCVIGDRLRLHPMNLKPSTAGKPLRRGGLLSVASASDHPEQATLRHARSDKPIAEDMEGFAVAVACRLFDTPLSILRGISNLAGDRDPTHWQIDAAMSALADALKHVIERDAT